MDCTSACASVLTANQGRTTYASLFFTFHFSAQLQRLRMSGWERLRPSTSAGTWQRGGATLHERNSMISAAAGVYMDTRRLTSSCKQWVRAESCRGSFGTDVHVREAQGD
jgi:hypothetical protein